MSLAITTNIASLIAQRNVSRNNSNLSSALKKMSSGLRINSASDDASGMIIADKLASQSNGLGQAEKNINDAISITEIADGALEESVNIVTIIKTKAIQAASDTQTADTRVIIQEDIDKLTEELDNIAKSTTYNGQKLLSGSFTNKIFQTGESAGVTNSLSIASAKSTQIGHTYVAEVIPDDSKLIYTTLKDNSTGENIELDAFQIQYDNTPENGIGALADQINLYTSKTDVQAIAIVESDSCVLSGYTGEDFSINGITIGSIKVDENDSDSSLVTAINKYTSETGVTASLSTDGKLELVSLDGRAIEVEGTFSPPAVIDKDALTTSGYLQIISHSSGQYDIAQEINATYESDTNIESEDITYIEWSSPNNGSGGDISATVNVTSTTGTAYIDNSFTHSPTDPDFISEYSSSIPELTYTTYSLGTIDSTITFSSALPTGSKLIILDADQGDSITLTNSGTALTLIDQVQTMIGGSGYPNYNTSTGTLTTGLATYVEASIFDISDLTSIDVSYIGSKTINLIILVGEAQEDESDITTIEIESIVSNQELLLLSDVDVTSSDAAQISIEIANESLKDLDNMRSGIGAVQNQLESTLSNVSNTRIQVKSSEATIRDLNFAYEMINYSKLALAQQTGAYALSQANKQQEYLISLLE